MRHFIGNEINLKSILSNILNRTCPNIILLYGDYGLGKSEFAHDIAKMLVCENLTSDGYCGHCSTCKEGLSSLTDNTFMNKISLTNMAMVDQEKVYNLVKENSSVLHQGSKVYIYDEFHHVPRAQQEFWLSESRRLDNTYLILTTTKTNQVDKGIVSRSVKLKMSPITKLQTMDLLKMYDLTELDSKLVTAIYEAFRGTPRDMITMARFCLNSGLSVDEQLELIYQYKRVPLEDLFQQLPNKVEYFTLLKDIFNTFSDEEIKRSVEDYAWDISTINPLVYKSKMVSQFIPQEYFTKLLLDISAGPKVALINLFNQYRFHKPGDDEARVTAAIDLSLRKSTKTPAAKTEKSPVEKW